jgi:tRNA(Arg) A34 adenosine deaminase TadA
MIRSITSHDIDMFYQLERLKEQSKCIDKQVACVIVDAEYDIIGSGVNTILQCDKNCHDKDHRSCKVYHAEIMAVRSLYSFKMAQTWRIPTRRKAYTSLFPCKACQEVLLDHVDEIVTFGMIHKDWVAGEKLTVFHHLPYTLLKHNGAEKQRSIVQGELAELITAISDTFSRDDKESGVEKLVDEIYDAELQIELLKIMAHDAYPEAYNILRKTRADKTAKLLKKYGEYGLSSYGINN